MKIWGLNVGLAWVWLLAMAQGVAIAGELVQVKESFDSDPGWEGIKNRVEAIECPVAKQDFGWSPTSYASEHQGELGGVIRTSTTPAWYALPLGQSLTLKEPFSFSGKLAVRRCNPNAVAYIGFFNSKRQSWRMWSSVAFRVSAWWLSEGQIGNNVQLIVDYASALWNGGELETNAVLPTDGSVHSFRLAWDPSRTIEDRWPQEMLRLKQYFAEASSYDGGERGDQEGDRLLAEFPKMDREEMRRRVYAAKYRSFLEETIYTWANAKEPGLTRAQFQKQLYSLAEKGLILPAHRYSKTRWMVRYGDLKEYRGLLTFQVDDQRFAQYLTPEWQKRPFELDRFGIISMQLYGEEIELYLADLTLNGLPIDLSIDPHWEENGNRVSFVERDFHGRHNFGYSHTNWAGERPGEIGGKFWCTEPIDPLHGYYGADVGKLTLDDPLSFSGDIVFLEGETDAFMYFGYFNSKELRRQHTNPLDPGGPIPASMGIWNPDSTAIGYHFAAFCHPNKETERSTFGPLFYPDGPTKQGQADSSV